MKLRLSILLLAAALAAAPAAGQTIKSLGYNTTNGNIVAATNVTFTNSVGFATNARAATRTNLGGTTVGNAVFVATDAAAARSAIGAGTVNEGGEPSFESVTANLFTADSINEATGGLQALDLLNFSLTFGTNYVLEWSATDVQLNKPLTFFGTNTASTTRTNLGLGAFKNPDNYAELLNASGQTVLDVEDSVAVYRAIDWAGTNSETYKGGTRTNLGLGASNDVVFNSLELNGAGLLVDESGFFSLTVTTNFAGINFVNGTTPMFTLTGSLATFATNVTVNGNLSVGSLTTTTPSTWALDATQTAAATNGRLTLPSNANVIRLTNNNAISSVTNGVLGAFYYLVNQTTNAVTISNVGGITVQGGTPLTLGAGQAATLVATGATNASVAARGDLTDVALGGTLNTAPSQTNASSASSLMTRDLVGQEFANPRNRMQTTYWFGLEGLGEWSLIGSGALSGYTASVPGFGGARIWFSSHMVGTNHSGAGLRLGADNINGSSPYRFTDGGPLTMRARIRRQDIFGRPSIAFLMGVRTATQMWQQDAYGLYFVPQPTNVWTSNGVVAQHDRIAVSNVVWAVNTAGTNDTTEPVWTDLIGSLVTNGSAIYRNLGPHTSNNWVLAIGSTNASQVVMTNTGKAGVPLNSRQEVALKLRIDGTTNTPYTVYGSVENAAGESTEVSLTTTNIDTRQPQFWTRSDDLGTRTNAVYDVMIKYFSIDGSLGAFQN